MTKHKMFFSHKASRAVLNAIVAGSLMVGAASTSVAGPREQAKRLHDRLAGIPPTDDMLCVMAFLIANDADNGGTEAAYLVMSLEPAADTTNIPNLNNAEDACPGIGAGNIDNSASRKAFYSVSLKDYFTPWTNAARTKLAPLNDATATLIGMVRDDVSFTEALYGNIVYVPTDENHNSSSNQQYEDLERDNLDLSDTEVLAPAADGQEVLNFENQHDGDGVAGLFSLRGTGEAFYSAGTNRRMIDYMMFNFICNGLLSSAAELSDATRPADRILQDTSRSPGGDSSVYLNQCIGCHAGMDPFKGGLAYYDWDEIKGRVTYIFSATDPVQPKFVQNATVFPAGYVTTDDSWLNYWREGSNERLQWGWDAATTRAAPYKDAEEDTDRVTSGNGAESFGREIASTKAFAQCQVERAYEHVCLQKPVAADQTFLDGLVDDFKTTEGNHSVRWIFAKVAPLCMGKNN